MVARNKLILQGFIALVFTLLSLGLFPGEGSAGKIRVIWDPNTEPELAGYKVYCGTASRTYTVSIDVGNVNAYTVTGLTTGQTYFLAATAYDAFRDESDFSNEASGVATEEGTTISLSTNPSGLEVMVDETKYPSPQSFRWSPGSVHTVSVFSPQDGIQGTRYLYASWSDGGAQTHTVAAPSSSATYTANFVAQYSLNTTTSPSEAGTVSPAGVTWYNSNQTVTLSATPLPGYTFSGWAGDLTGLENPISFAMNGPKSATAQFTQSPVRTETVSTPAVPSGPIQGKTQVSYSYVTGQAFSSSGHTVQYQFDWKGDGSDLSPWGFATQSKTWASSGTYHVKARSRCSVCAGLISSWSAGLQVTMTAGEAPSVSYVVRTNPEGLQITVDGTNYVSPRAFDWQAGSVHSLSVPSPQSGKTGTQFGFASWSDGGAQTHTITVPTVGTTYVAMLNVQHSLTATSNIPAGGEISPNGTAWFNRGETVTVLASANPGYRFTGWSGGLSGNTNPGVITMTGPKKVKARFKQEKYSLKVLRDPERCGTVSKSPNRSRFAYGEQVTLTAQPKPGYVFAGWSGDVAGTENPITLTMSGNVSIQPIFSQSMASQAAKPETVSQALELPLAGRLENPGNGKVVAGVRGLYGWALDGNGISKVELLIDGRYVCDIPYGSRREDIGQMYPDYPDADESGFAMVMNYGNLNPGKHLISVRAHSVGGETLDLTSEVWVAKFHGDLVTAMSPKAWPIPGIEVTAGTVTKSYDVRLEWSDETQAFELSEIIEK